MSIYLNLTHYLLKHLSLPWHLLLSPKSLSFMYLIFTYYFIFSLDVMNVSIITIKSAPLQGRSTPLTKINSVAPSDYLGRTSHPPPNMHPHGGSLYGVAQRPRTPVLCFAEYSKRRKGCPPFTGVAFAIYPTHPPIGMANAGFLIYQLRCFLSAAFVFLITLNIYFPAYTSVIT